MQLAKRLIVALVLLIAIALPAFAQSSTIIRNGDFLVEYLGVQYDVPNGTSTWTYRITWNGNPPALSHWILQGCGDLTQANVIAGSPSIPKVGNDPTTGVFGLKFDIGQNVLTQTYSFTINRLLSEQPGLTAAIKAGTGVSTGLISGPSLSCDLCDAPQASLSSKSVCFLTPSATFGVSASGDGPFTYTWSFDNVRVGGNEPTLTVDTSSLAVGSYPVKVVISGACGSITRNASLDVLPLPEPTISANGPTTFCEGGSVTLTAEPAGLSYLWSNGATTQSITVSASGSYSVTATDGNSCAATSAPVSVTVNPPPDAQITADGPTTFCEGGSVTLTASPAGGSYLWSNGATTPSITVSDSGSYSVTVTNENGCSDPSDPVSVTVVPPPDAQVTAEGATTFCEGGSVTLTASPAGMSYLWSNGETTQSIVVAAAGSYSVTVTNDTGCTDASAPVSVTVNPPPDAQVSADGPTTFCEGGSVTLTASPAGMSYLWSNGSTDQSITVSASGSFSVTVTNENGCSDASDAVVVTVNPPPDAQITADGPTTFCEGGSVTLTASPAGGTYLWSTGETTQSIVVSASGSYSVTVTNENGCSDDSDPVSVTVVPPPDAQITADGPTAFCEGGSVTLTASPAGMTYLWSNGETTQSIVVSASGSYSVTVTNDTGCFDASDPVVVTVNPPPDATVTADGPTTFCEGGSVTLTAMPAGMTYLWSNGATSQSITISASGSFFVTVTNENGCSDASDPVNVTVNPPPDAQVTADGPTTFCEGGSVTLTALPAGLTYLWSNGSTDQSITVSTSGSYSVTVTNENGCSDASDPVDVTVVPPPDAQIQADGPTTFCEGGSVTLTAMPAGMTYLWSNGSTDQSIIVSQGDSYSVTVTNGNGCAKASAPVTVTVNPVPDASIEAGGPTTFCEGGSVVLTALPAGLSYLWSTGETTQSIVALDDAIYSVTVTNEFGCPDTASISVTVHQNPDFDIQGPVEVCQLTEGNVAEVVGAEAGSTFAWTIANGVITSATDGSSIEFTTGTSPTPVVITVTVTDSFGCSSTRTLEVRTLRCDEACTLTMGAYGNAGGYFNGLSTQMLIESLLATPITVGAPGRSLSIDMTGAPCIILRLPAGGPAAELPSIGDAWMNLPGCQTSPKLPVDKGGKLRNVLLGQTIALSLNVRLNDGELANINLCNLFTTQGILPGPDGLRGTADDVLDPGADGIVGPVFDPVTGTWINDDPIASFQIPGDVLAALDAMNLPRTPAGVLALANAGLGGLHPPVALSEINNAVNSINRGFDECRMLLECTAGIANMNLEAK